MSAEFTFETHSDEETRVLGAALAKQLPKRGVVLLIGNLGVGKTTLTKGIVEGLGAATADDVSSPTFTLIHEYGEPVSVYHVDLYRLDTEEEVQRLGLDEIFEQPAMILLEWAERFPRLLPAERVEIYLSDESNDVRKIRVRTVAI